MTLLIGLVFAALLLIFFEVILPGGVLGVLAIVCVIAATWVGHTEFGLIGAVVVFFTTCFLAAVTIFLEFKFLARTGLAKGFFLKESVTGHSNESAAEDSIIGKEGTALTRLNPSGKVAIEGQSYEAHSQDGYIHSGKSVCVVAKDSFKLIIRKL